MIWDVEYCVAMHVCHIRSIRIVYHCKKWVVVLNIRCGYLSCNVANFFSQEICV